MAAVDALPRITVVTPSLNQGDFLEKTIRSVLDQGYPQLEYIIIDGGSSDGSVDIIRRYADRLAFWCSEPDRGQSHAINKGLSRATGVLMNWINADDVLFPGALHRVAETYRRRPNADLYVGQHARSGPDGRIIHASAVPLRAALAPRYKVTPLGQQSTFFTARAYRRVGGVREDLHMVMDNDLYQRIFLSGGRLARVAGMVGLIREHPQAKTSRFLPAGRQETRRLWREQGIHPWQWRLGAVKQRLVMLLTGTYARTLLLRRKWVGKTAWGEGGPGGAPC